MFILAIWCAPNPGAMQADQGPRREAGESAGRDRGGLAVAAASDGRAEFRELFVSLVDPAGVLDTDRAGEIASKMEEAASRAGYDSGTIVALTVPTTCTTTAR